jgi:hypothetical protein
MDFLIHTLIIQAAVGVLCLAIRRLAPNVDAMYVFLGGALASSIAGIFFAPPYTTLQVAGFAIAQGVIFAIFYVIAIVFIGAFDDEA